MGGFNQKPSLISFASVCFLYPRPSDAWLGYKTQTPGICLGFVIVALPVQFSNLFLDDLKRLANLAA